MAFTSQSQAKRVARTGATAPILLRVKDVDPQAGTLTCSVTLEDNPENLTVAPGDYVLSMDMNAISPSDRERYAQKSKSRYFGGLIGQKMASKVGEPLIAEGFQATAPGHAVVRWLNSANSERTENKPALIHTRKVVHEGQAMIETAGITVINPNAFDVFHDGQLSPEMAKSLDICQDHFKRCTIPSTVKNGAGQSIQWASMPSSSAIFAILDKDNQVIETTELYKEIPHPEPSDYPDWLPESERIRIWNGKTYPRKLPLHANMLNRIAHEALDYMRGKYGDDAKLVCIRGTELKASRSVDDDNIDMRALEGSNRPLDSCHKDNQNVYLRDPADTSPDALQKNLSFVPSVAFTYAANKGSTFSKYITTRHSYGIGPQHPLTQCQYNGESLKMKPELAVPINHPSHPFKQMNPNASTQAPQQTQQAQAPQQTQQAQEPQQTQQAQAPQQTQQAQEPQQTQQAQAPQQTQHAQEPQQTQQAQEPQQTQQAQEPQQTQQAQEPAHHHDSSAEFDANQRINDYINASGGNAQSAPATQPDPDFPLGGNAVPENEGDADFPLGGNFAAENEGEPDWLDGFNDTFDDTPPSDKGSEIDNSDNPATKTAPVRNSSFDMPFT
ncbi:hypothetical protein [Vreelandella rituensis]|uniref:hypothetical protein n=1 Tax=Vreelandella rituensis TaxID=2282306 RepID=UPI0015F068B7|nr:hypothetical protein [Halomonas rituensis]